MSGIKNSLASDSASTNQADSEGEGPAGEESEQFVIVDGHEGGHQVMGDETLIEPYPYDTSSVSSHQTHASSSRIRQMSQVIPICWF